ncbi:hypothetical protein ACFSTE_16600 [Aquimarina hainanensis]|uniref:Uncharacterized protein n=1 Tax=Aquimarina hainanensis TaxID=1578017 RepID=A0ABW5NA10_9FLAO|nr:hypothetical protein [Aquimarina sp. TRL1]QKX07027.1 hypothetical protein HN014_19625 [Aquimarina sp. TRL1]
MKLIRKIRQEIIENGSLKNYIVFAIGEIPLVMLGILLALQVNNWNQHRIESKKEEKILIDLQKEFTLNKERIREKQLLRTSIAPKLKKYIEQIITGKAGYSSFEEFHSNQFMFGMTNPSKGVINTLISSGEIALISNDSLKYFIADWKNQTENLYENEQILWNSGLEYIQSYSNKIPIPTHQWHDWNDKKLAVAFGHLISDIAYKNHLIGFEGVNTIVVEECNAVIKLLERILSLLENEIKKNR